MITKFKVFEGIRDKMTPKSKEDILKNIDGNPTVTFKRIHIEVTSTFLIGEIEANYYDLLQLFGEPSEEEWIGNNFHWSLESSKGNYITIYDNNSGMEGYELMDVDYHWHIGGTDKADFNDLAYYIYNHTLD